jgi:hypothetical protein
MKSQLGRGLPENLIGTIPHRELLAMRAARGDGFVPFLFPASCPVAQAMNKIK